MTFKDIQIGEVFVTCCDDTLFLKVREDKTVWGGGNCYEIATGKHPWIPDQRRVSLPKQKHFTEAGQKYRWKKDCEAATKALTSQC